MHLRKISVLVLLGAVPAFAAARAALADAAEQRDKASIRALLGAGAGVNALNRYGVPPLAQACTNGNAAIVKLLLEAEADANATMKGRETVLMLAARSGN